MVLHFSGAYEQEVQDAILQNGGICTYQERETYVEMDATNIDTGTISDKKQYTIYRLPTGEKIRYTWTEREGKKPVGSLEIVTEREERNRHERTNLNQS